MTSIRAALRPPLAAGLWPAVRPFNHRLERGRDGGALRPGITAVVAARNESWSIGFALRSLLGFADQIVCVDNGSNDATLAQMHTFRKAHRGDVEVDVVSLPEALLGECREEALRRSRCQWHLRWDADMVAQTSGPDSILAVRERALHSARPRAIHFRRTNLIGDLWHMSRLGPVLDTGESWLLRFGTRIRYREFEMYDDVRIPLHYSLVREPGFHCLHLAGLKSDENLIHRFHYFAWRRAANLARTAAGPDVGSLPDFTQRRNLELFGTDEPCSLKFRYQRQLCYHLAPYDPQRWGRYPDALEEELTRSPRFEVVYRDGRPWTRVDREDAEMLEYEPTPADMEWDPEAFLRRFLSDEELQAADITPAG